MEIRNFKEKNRLTIVVAAVLVVLVSWIGVIDVLSKEYVNTSTIQAFAAYGTARIFNAAVSLASSISISASLGFGFDINPFKILQPISDLVEDYSTAMKFSISSLVIQKIIVEAVSTFFFKVVLTALGAIFVASMYFRKGFYSFLLFRIFAFFALIRFLLVLVIMMNGLVDQAFVDKSITPHMADVREASSKLSQETNPEGEMSVDERLGLENLRNDLVAQKGNLEQDVIEKNILLKNAEESASSVESRIDSMEEEMSAVERMNFFSREDEYKEEKEKLELAQDKAGKIEMSIDEIENAIGKVESDIQNIDDILSGKSVDKGWMSEMKDKLSSFKDMAKWERITSTMNDIIPSLLSLMAAFVFKTLIMPLIFLLLFLKGFKYIWGVDPRVWLKSEYKSLREEK